MKRFACVGTMVLVCLALASPAVAQPPASDAWQVSVTPYLMGAAISGTAGARGVEAEIDLPASDVFSHLEFGFMGSVAARKGDWGIGTDLIFMALGATADRPAADVDFNQTAFALYGLRRLNAVAEATFGVRVNGLDGGLTFKDQSVVPAGTELSQSKWWVDPIVGLRLHSNSARRVNATLYGEIGGFGLGSDLAWQIFPVVDVRVLERMSLELGYRWLSMDYTTGDGSDRFTWDTLTQGPVVGFKFQF
jgi:opacity protein-like surface antigen